MVAVNRDFEDENVAASSLYDNPQLDNRHEKGRQDWTRFDTRAGKPGGQDRVPGRWDWWWTDASASSGLATTTTLQKEGK
ncbi:hypothetical protein VCV18_001990 [Metarhizium anisopliae]